MSRNLICVVTAVALFAHVAGAKSPTGAKKVVLLPVEQTDIRNNSVLSDGQLSELMLIRLARLKGFELVRFDELSEAVNKRLVDDRRDIEHSCAVYS